MATKKEAAPDAMEPEQAAELAELQAQAEPAPVAAGAPGAAPEAAPVDLAGELRALVTMFVQMVGPVFPSLPKIYTPEATAAAAEAVASVCNKHGWAQGGLMGEWGEEIAAAVVLAPLALATYTGIRADIAGPKKAPALGAAPAGAATVSDTGEVNQSTLTFGAVIPAAPEPAAP